MSNIIKKVAGKYSSALKVILDAQKETNAKVNHVFETQLSINHSQLEVLNEVKDRAKNSGTLVLSNELMVSKIFSGLKIYLDPRDIAVAPHIALDAIWEHRITSAWLAVVGDNDTVLDIGSNFGYFGALAAQRTDKHHSKVIHFEANPHLIPYIRKTLAVNWLNEQSVIENVAVADKEGEVTLHLLKDYVGSSSIHDIKHTDSYLHDKMYVEEAEAIKVRATTIDAYCKANKIQEVNLIKMDIEGFEDKAYEGMRGTISKSPNATLFIEFTKESYEDPKGFYKQLLTDFGNVYVIDDEGYIVKPKDSSYKTVLGAADDWVMPIFSKNNALANRK